MIKIGHKQTLLVDAEDNSGFYLLCEEEKEVFMPGTLAPDGLKVGEKIEVFVFIDSKGDEIATATMPLAEVGDFACLVVKDVTRHGAFLDIGLPKDLLVPNKLQKYDMQPGGVHLVKVMLDEENMRLFGTEKIGPYIEFENVALEKKQLVKLVPFHETPLGFKVLIDKKYVGMVYHNEIFQKVELGQEYQGSVKTVRSDGQVDALLQKTGISAVKDGSDLILAALEKAGGKLELWDKSSPDEIKDALGMSKKAFKSAIGILYKKRLIALNEGSIELLQNQQK